MKEIFIYNFESGAGWTKTLCGMNKLSFAEKEKKRNKNKNERMNDAALEAAVRSQ